MLAQVINSVSIKNDYILRRQVFYQCWKELSNIRISSQTWSHNPYINRIAPSHYLLHPNLWNLLSPLTQKTCLFIGNKNRMYDNLWGVSLDGSCWGFVTKNMPEIASHFQGRNGGVKRGSCKLITATDNSDSAVLSLDVLSGEIRENFDKIFHNFWTHFRFDKVILLKGHSMS